jgi:hypothetical protein
VRWLLLVSALFIPALIILYFVVALAHALYLEVRRTSWSLLEALIAVNIIGHAIAWPVALACQADAGWYSLEQRVALILAAVFCGSLAAACMGGGAVWVFRRLKILGEKRTGTRILYMLGGLFLFPSFIVVGTCVFVAVVVSLADREANTLWLVPVGLVVAAIMWPPLYRLHRRTKDMLS